MSVDVSTLRAQIAALGDPLDRIRSGVEKFGDAYADAPARLPEPPSDEGRAEGTREAVAQPPTSPARTQPPTAEETASRTETAPATDGPYRAFQTEADLDAWLAGEQARLKEQWRAESNRDWDGQGNELKRLTTLARAQERDVAALQGTIAQLTNETIPRLTAQLAEAAATRGVSDGDVYRHMQTVNPLQMATENVQRGRQALAEDDSRQTQAQEEQHRQAQALLTSRKGAGEYADAQRRDAVAALREFAIDNGIKLTQEDATARIKAAAADASVSVHGQSWAAAIDNRSIADLHAAAYWQGAQRLAAQGVQADALERLAKARPQPTYDPPQAHGTAAGIAAGGTDWKAALKESDGTAKIERGLRALDAQMGRA